MAINPNLLVTAPVLQDFLIDKSGLPMANGTITMYQDNSRTTLKNWYYQSGSPGNYTYITLPNPMTLSAAGTIVDVNGNDTLPFYYPFSETDNLTPQPYFVVIQNQAQTYTISRANFPYNPNGANPSGQSVPTLENYVINNRFWRNIGSVTYNGSSTLPNFGLSYAATGNAYYQTLAPDNHDGYSMPDFNYIKNVISATETITFTKFPSTTVLTDDITPEYYINFNCTGAGSGETFKVFQFPISLHIATLNARKAIFTIQGQSVSGTQTFPIYIYQFLGTGVISSAPVQIGNVVFTSVWSKQVIEFTFPSSTISPLILGNGGDDAFYLQIGMPANALVQVNFTLPSIYLSDNIQQLPSNSFSTYDQIDSIVGTPRTGDVRSSLNSFYPFGWVPMNDGTIGNASSAALLGTAARANIDTWPLYNLLWNSFSPYGSTQFPIYTNANPPVLSTYGASAIADFNANKAIALTKMMGRVILGDVPLTTQLSSTASLAFFQCTFTASSSSGLLITTTQSINSFFGMPIVFSNTGGSLPTGLSANTVYYIASDDSYASNTFHVSTTYANALAGTVIAYTNAGSGTNTVSLAPDGAITGEFFHSQLAREVGRHNHPGSSGDFLVHAAGDTFTDGVGAFTFTTNATTGNNTGGAPFNIMPSSTLMNMFIKL